AAADRREGLARLRGEVGALKTRSSASEEEVARLTATKDEALSRARNAQQEFSVLESQVAGIDQGEESLDAEYESAQSALVEAQAKVDNLKEEERRADRDRSTHEARLEALRMSATQKDGSALLLGAQLRGVLGSIANLVVVEPGWQAALSAALGNAADSIAVSDSDAAANAISHLKNADAGNASFIVGGARASSPRSSWPALPQGAVYAVDVIRSSADISATLEALLERTVLVESLDVRAQEVSDAAMARLHESDARMAALAEQMSLAGQAVRSANAEATRIEQAINEALSARERDLVGLAELESRLAQAESEPTDNEPDVATLETFRSAVAASRQREMDARLALRTGEERAHSAGQRAEQLERNAAAERAARATAVKRREARAIGAVTARAVTVLAQEALSALEISIAQAASERGQAEASRTEREGELLAVRLRARELTAELEQLTSSVHRDEVARAEYRLRIEALEGRVLEELGVDAETLLNEYGPEKEVPTFVENEAGDFVPGPVVAYVREEQEKRLRAAEKSLALLGRVNPLALEEFAALEERAQFLGEQLEDLKNTRRDLLEIIREVDERVEIVFREAFIDTAREFEGVFARLFPGGEGRLVLTNPDDMLTTGIEVEARPPGKKIKRLSLLSGGERSLTAVALLVAIFKARPSPFYVLDEVEAALDDTNLGRLISILDELRSSSQLIIITHQKRTMEIADALYGVTMRGDGVTEVISQRLREVESESV
ncbi:MAG: chromosome segregation protein SMC, partial [Actinobacteria bacterium]|nr:chromosome segregation protein SMC [Actinomycetota bacterium]